MSAPSDRRVVPVHDPTSRATNLRTTALASAVALVLALPLAFVGTGPTGTHQGVHARAGHPGPHAPQAPHAAPDAVPGPGAGAPAPRGPGSPAGAFCGPELRSPEGVEAQTCVLTEGTDTWGRVYYRNGTGKPLRGALTVRRPDGRTVEVRCEVPASAEPGLCETPREPTVAEERDEDSYSAVAELADAAGERLLRAGSARPTPGASRGTTAGSAAASAGSAAATGADDAARAPAEGSADAVGGDVGRT